MAFSYNIDEVSQRKLPSTQHDIQQAKKYLMKHSSESNNNLYDHLSELLGKILAERPNNAIDIFEEYSQQIKNEKFSENTGIRDVYIPPLQYSDSQQFIKLFKEVKEENDITNDRNKIMPNLNKLFYYLEQIDIGLSQDEIILLNLSIRKIITKNSLINIRFWGKILGRPKNYYVVDAELSEEELSRRLELNADERFEMDEAQVQDDDGVKMSTNWQKDNANVEANVADGDGGDSNEKKKGLNLVFPPMPVSNWKPPPVIPTEQIGMGLNKMIYFVCNSPGLDEWIELPSVTPQQIVVARQIVRGFTGCLETPINTFPKFPGNEGNYLRAQIARISASTHVSPIGYFTYENDMNGDEIDEEDEIDEVDDVRDLTIEENQHYNIVSVKDLVDPSMSNWCHHTQYILEQGRTIWWDESEKYINEEELSETMVEAEEEEEEEEEEEVEDDMKDEIVNDEGNRNKKEIGLPLLTPLSQDIMIGTMIPAWTGRLSSEIQQESAIAMIRSNVWPGAIAFAKDKFFGNIYIGWGHKFNAKNYCPSILPLIQDQYKIGPEIMEIQDPTAEAEGYQNDRSLSTEFSDSIERGELSEEDEVNDDDDDDDTDN